MDYRVTIQWTETAKKALAKLPKKVRKGLLEKFDELAQADPRSVHKPLTGFLQGYRRVVYGRYRAIYSAEAEELENGDIVTVIRVVVVLAGIRKEGDKQDIYRVAQKLIDLGLIPPKDAES